MSGWAIKDDEELEQVTNQRRPKRSQKIKNIQYLYYFLLILH